MKDLLEVIEEGREEFDEEFGRNWTPETFPHPLGIRNYHTNNTKAILTNQIERMKGEMKEQKYKRKNMFEQSNKTKMQQIKLRTYTNAHNQALQTQIDYLEDVIKKLNNG